MRGWHWPLLLALLAGACGKSAAIPKDGGVDLAVGTEAGLTACLDRPGELERPPTGRLPCDLIPPGLRL
jgi:hypothetical protein